MKFCFKKMGGKVGVTGENKIGQWLLTAEDEQ